MTVLPKTKSGITVKAPKSLSTGRRATTTKGKKIQRTKRLSSTHKRQQYTRTLDPLPELHRVSDVAENDLGEKTFVVLNHGVLDDPKLWKTSTLLNLCVRLQLLESQTGDELLKQLEETSTSSFSGNVRSRLLQLLDDWNRSPFISIACSQLLKRSSSSPIFNANFMMLPVIPHSLHSQFLKSFKITKGGTSHPAIENTNVQKATRFSPYNQIIVFHLDSHELSSRRNRIREIAKSVKLENCLFPASDLENEVEWQQARLNALLNQKSPLSETTDSEMTTSGTDMTIHNLIEEEEENASSTLRSVKDRQATPRRQKQAAELYS